MANSDRYQIVLISPAGYEHARGLDEVGLLLEASFASLSLACQSAMNSIDPTATNIILGYHFLHDADVLRNHRCVIYQLEQLSNREGWFNAARLDALRAAHEVWDYDPSNIAFLREHGIAAKHVPLGYHERLAVIPPAAPDIDVLFYGSINDRRAAILDQLASQCRLQTLFGVYGGERDQMIARSKIVLNIHFYESQIMEQVRLSYLLNNRRFVVSEDSRENPYRGLIAAAPYRELVDCCLRYLHDDAAREAMTQTAAAEFARRTMADSLKSVLRPSAEATSIRETPPRRKHTRSPLDLAKNAQYFRFDRAEVVQTLTQHQIRAERILELGCASGAAGKNIKQALGATYYCGIDNSQAAIHEARSNLDTAIHADIERTSCAALGLGENDFDLLVALDVLEHIYNPWDVLADLVGCVKLGGHVVLSLPNVQNITILNGLASGHWTYEDAGLLDVTHVRFFTLEGIAGLIEGAGLEMVSTNSVINPQIDVASLPANGIQFAEGKLALNSLTKEEVIRLWTYQYVVLARKVRH